MEEDLLNELDDFDLDDLDENNKDNNKTSDIFFNPN